MEATLEGQYLKFGVLVDAVNEVHEIEPGKILPSPTIGNKFKSEFLEGIYQNGDSFIMIVNIENVLIFDNVNVLKASISENAPELTN